MDGNGRWAKLHGKSRSFGHLEGLKTVDKIISYASKLGIDFLTLYAFSTENWKRSKTEVEFIMKIFKNKLEEAIARQNRNIRFRFIGEKNGISDNIIELVHTLEKETENNSGMNLNIAFNYGAKAEIINSVNLILKDYKNNGTLSIDEIKFENYLYTKNQPNVDLLIRTGGEFRISNFLLWQIAYAELFFCKTFWPEFSEKDFDTAIEEFNRRERRYGNTI